MAGFPKTGKMAIYNIQLFGKGGEVLVYKLNGKQHAYAESIPKEQLVDEVTKSDNICYYRSNTPLFHIHDAVDMEDCIIKMDGKDLDLHIQQIIMILEMKQSLKLELMEMK